MISKKELLEYAKLKKFNLGQAEKDYLQEIILSILYREFGNELVFKGGTALTKCYGFDRFSEDLDFTTTEDLNFEKLVSKGLKKYYLDFIVKEKNMNHSIKLTYNINGPLYIGTPNSTCKIILDFSFREKILLKTSIKKIGLLINEIPNFDVVVMSEEEIFAEKIRAIMTRNKARDLYDLYLLTERNIFCDIDLINKKLNLFNLSFKFLDFKKSIELKKNIWESELKYLIKNVPEFKIVVKKILNHFKEKSRIL
jgi:predicted nucleotidyltransferase component of viral defense system